ncbi:MAG: fibronectin type III domain-containing protein, partial [Sulfuricaulis sp.]
TAAAASGYSFAGWSGACSGTSVSCTVSMTTARSVTASFGLTLSNAATLAWDLPVNAVGLSGYRLYYGTATGKYQQAYGQGISVGNVTTYTLLGLSSGTRYYFAVTAIDNLGNESVYSNEAFKDVP